MSQHTAQNGPPEIPRDAYPMARLTSEFFLRSIDLLTRVQGDKLISGLVFMAVWHNHMKAPGSGAVGHAQPLPAAVRIDAGSHRE